MAASSSAVSDQASAIAKNVITSQQAESLQQAIHIPGSINQRNSHHNSAPLLPSPVSSLQNLTNNASADLSSTNYNCANCDIKFDSESSLRVHLQVSSIVWISIIIYHSTTVQQKIIAQYRGSPPYMDFGTSITRNLHQWDYREFPTDAKIPCLHVQKPKIAVVGSAVVKTA